MSMLNSESLRNSIVPPEISYPNPDPSKLNKYVFVKTGIQFRNLNF